MTTYRSHSTYDGDKNTLGSNNNNFTTAEGGEPILISEAIVIQPNGVERHPGLDLLMRRLAGVMTARNYKMVDYNVAAANLERASAITPGIDSPTVSHLAREGWLAVRAMIPAKQSHAIMDDLWHVGAEGILVTEITACRL